MADDLPLHEKARLLSYWAAGTYPTPEVCAHQHWVKHGQPRGLGKWQYLRMAADFNKAVARRSPPQGLRNDGTVRWKKSDGEFLIEDGNDGTILSYGPPES